MRSEGGSYGDDESLVRSQLALQLAGSRGLQPRSSVVGIEGFPQVDGKRDGTMTLSEVAAAQALGGWGAELNSVSKATFE